MRRYIKKIHEGMEIFVGIDMHKTSWHVTIMSEPGEVWHGNIPGEWEALHVVFERYRGCRIHAVYEAGYFGYWLYDRIVEYGATCIVTPPGLMPMEYGNRVKTDRRDSKKLAYLIQKDLLKDVYVPTEEERSYRQVFRQRRQLLEDWVKAQHRIKSALLFCGTPGYGAIPAPGTAGLISGAHAVPVLHRREDTHGPYYESGQAPSARHAYRGFMSTDPP